MTPVSLNINEIIADIYAASSKTEGRKCEDQRSSISDTAASMSNKWKTCEYKHVLHPLMDAKLKNPNRHYGGFHVNYQCQSLSQFYTSTMENIGLVCRSVYFVQARNYHTERDLICT